MSGGVASIAPMLTDGGPAPTAAKGGVTASSGGTGQAGGANDNDSGSGNANGSGGGSSAFRGELERLAKRERTAFASANKRIDELLASLQSAADALSEDDASLAGVNSSVAALAKGVGDCKNQLAKEFKGLFSAVTDFGTEIENGVARNLEGSCKPDVFASATITQVIADSLLRDGRVALAQSLADEVRAHGSAASASALAVDAQRGVFEEMHAVVTALRARNVQPAINWTTKQRNAILASRGDITGSGNTSAATASHLDLKYPSPSAVAKTKSASSSSGSAMETDEHQPFSHAKHSTPSTGSAAKPADTKSAETLAGLTDLLFSLHRLRFLQLLTADSPCTVHHTASPAGPAAQSLTLSRALSLSGSSSTAAAATTSTSATAPMQLSSGSSPSPSPSPSPSLRAATSSASSSTHATASASTTSTANSSVYPSFGMRMTTAPASPTPASPSSSSAAAAAEAATPPSKGMLSARITQYTLKALAYAQQHFSAFTTTHMAEIQRLSGCVLFGWDVTRCAASYPDLNSTALWVSAENAFRVQSFASIGVAQRSPLEAALAVSDIALPKLLKHAAMTQQNAHLLAHNRDAALAVELDLGDEHQYHTTFICPVTKEQTSTGGGTGSAGAGDNNLPVLLRCGHVISSQAMHKMIRSNRLSRTGRFKCPTCPKEQNPSEVVTLHF